MYISCSSKFQTILRMCAGCEMCLWPTDLRQLRPCCIQLLACRFSARSCMSPCPSTPPLGRTFQLMPSRSSQCEHSSFLKLHAILLPCILRMASRSLFLFSVMKVRPQVRGCQCTFVVQFSPACAECSTLQRSIDYRTCDVWPQSACSFSSLRGNL